MAPVIKNMTVDRLVSIRQSIKAGSNFNAGAPKDGVTGLTPTMDAAGYLFAPGTEGGLFDLPNTGVYSFYPRMPLQLLGIAFKGGTQASLLLQLIDPDGDTFDILKGTNETTLVSVPHQPPVEMYLPWGSKLAFTTTGASGALSLKLLIAPCRGWGDVQY